MVSCNIECVLLSDPVAVVRRFYRYFSADDHLGEEEERLRRRDYTGVYHLRSLRESTAQQLNLKSPTLRTLDGVHDSEPSR